MRHASNFKNADDHDARIDELRWFACHCYNTALKHCSDMQPELLTRFMMASLAVRRLQRAPRIAAYKEQLIDLLRNEDKKDDGLLNRLLLCRFLAASALIVLARSEDNIERAVSAEIHHLENMFTNSKDSCNYTPMPEDKSGLFTRDIKKPNDRNYCLQTQHRTWRSRNSK